MWKSCRMTDNGGLTVWEWLRKCAANQSGSFTSQEVVSWFRRHAPDKANDRTVRTHVRGACWNVEDRSQFSPKEPVLTRMDRGLFRTATLEEIEQWRAGQPPVATEQFKGVKQPALEPCPPSQVGPDLVVVPPKANPGREEWHREVSIQASVVTDLVTKGWQIVSVANTATRQHGIDVIASRDDQTVGVEVKGYPSLGYADPARAGEVKPTKPSTQAGHWFSQAVLAAMRLRGKEPTW